MYLHDVVHDLVVGKMQGDTARYHVVQKNMLFSRGCLGSGAEPDIPSCRLCGFATPCVEEYGLLLYWADVFLCVLLYAAE